jgi:hypothetical protein
MPASLRRGLQSEESHFMTFSCYRRQPNFADRAVYDLWESNRSGRREIASCRQSVVRPEHSCAQVSVQRQDANLGHPAPGTRQEAGFTTEDTENSEVFTTDDVSLLAIDEQSS